MSRTRRLGRLMLILTVLFGTALGVLTVGEPAKAHGEDGQRLISLWDVNIYVANAPRALYQASNTYISQLMNSQKGNDCLSPMLVPARFPGEDPVTSGRRMGPPQPGGDYEVYGDLSGAEGNYQLRLSLVTARTRELVAEASDSFVKASDAAWSGTVAAMNLAGTGTRMDERSLADKLLEWEKKQRKEYAPEVAIAPKVELLEYGPKMQAGSSQTLKVRLLDCDGHVLKDAKVKVSADRGQLSAGKLIIDGSGLATVQYTAPNAKTAARIKVEFDFDFPSERHGYVNDNAFITVVKPEEEEVAIWRLSLEYNYAIDLQLKSAPGTLALLQQNSSLSESLSPLRMEFDISQKINPLRETLKSDYNWKWEQRHTGIQGAVTSQTVGTDSGTKVVEWDARLKRHLKPVQGEQRLDVYDADEVEKELMEAVPNLPVSQPAETAVITFQATLPGNSRTNSNILGHVEDESFEMLPSFDETFDFEYQFTQPVHEGLAKLPVPNFGLGQVTRNDIKYGLALKQLSFDYDPTGWGGEKYLSGRTTIKVDGKDRSDSFKLVVFTRDWVAPVNWQVLGAPRSGRYAGSAWVDNREMSQAGPVISDFASVVPEGPSEGWPGQVLVREHLVAVERFPEFGFLYYINAVKLEPYRYTLMMFKPKRITADDWAKIKQGDQPHQNEESAEPAVRLQFNQ